MPYTKYNTPYTAVTLQGFPAPLFNSTIRDSAAHLDQLKDAHDIIVERSPQFTIINTSYTNIGSTVSIEVPEGGIARITVTWECPLDATYSYEFRVLNTVQGVEPTGFSGLNVFSPLSGVFGMNIAMLSVVTMDAPNPDNDQIQTYQLQGRKSNAGAANALMTNFTIDARLN